VSGKKGLMPLPAGCQRSGLGVEVALGVGAGVLKSLDGSDLGGLAALFFLGFLGR
jgi:hypothetical protein